MFTNIVVPLDGSPDANVALAQAGTIARATSAAVTLIRVLGRGDAAPEATAALQSEAGKLVTSGLQVEVVVRHGNPADEILNEVRTRHSDLVVMRTRGRSGLGRALLGSVAERMVQDSPTPVLLLSPGGRSASTIHTLLVPVDGSPGAAIALATALELANTTGAELKLLQVVVPVAPYLFHSVAMQGPIYVDPAWDEDAEAAAQIYMTSITRRMIATGVAVSGQVVVAGSVSEAIIRSADEQGIDVIVMSSEALTGAARAFLGSVTDAVVRTAHCPVLVLRRPSAEAEEDQDGSASKSN
jgi:nucleotide-binding universal stress UspA family protein